MTQDILSLGLLLLTMGYSQWTIHAGHHLLGWLDHLTLILIFVFLDKTLETFSRRSRSTIRFCLIALFALYTYLNTLHFRFFHTWDDASATRQWEDLRSIWSSLKVLSKPSDLLFFFVGPCLAWILLGDALFSKVSKKMLMILILIFSVTHTTFASPEILYNENDAILFALRRQASRWIVSWRENPSKVSVSGHTPPYPLINSTLYQNAGDPTSPLLKIPRRTIRSLPFQLEQKPNVVLVLMESVRAYESGAYGARPSLTPHLDQLAKEGILFKNFYANSYQTARGEFAVQSSYLPRVHGTPEYISHPHASLMTWPALLRNHGYATLWIGSYSPTYDNKQDFLSHHAIDSFYSDIPKGYRKVGWGPSDEDLFDYAYSVLTAQKAPYFAEIMTLSDHFPWDDPMPNAGEAPSVHGDAMYQKYARGMFYTDYAIGKFMKRIRSDSRFDHTLFIFCGDHGIWLFPDEVPHNSAIHQEVYFRVPLILWSKELAPRVIETIGSQMDIGPSVLDLFGIYEKNTLAGTSLFRHDIPARLVLMSQDGRWNMRRGNIYTYDVGPELFETHYPFNEADYERLVKNKHMAHMDFTTDEDILHGTDLKHLKLLDNSDQTRHSHEFAASAFGFYDSLMAADKISPSEGK